MRQSIQSAFGMFAAMQAHGLTYPVAVILQNARYPARMEPETSTYVEPCSEQGAVVRNHDSMVRMFGNVRQINAQAKAPEGTGLVVWIELPEKTGSASSGAAEPESEGDSEVAGAAGEQSPSAPATELTADSPTDDVAPVDPPKPEAQTQEQAPAAAPAPRRGRPPRNQ